MARKPAQKPVPWWNHYGVDFRLGDDAACAQTWKELCVPHETRVVSAHRNAGFAFELRGAQRSAH